MSSADRSSYGSTELIAGPEPFVDEMGFSAVVSLTMHELPLDWVSHSHRSVVPPGGISQAQNQTRYPIYRTYRLGVLDYPVKLHFWRVRFGKRACGLCSAVDRKCEVVPTLQ